MNTYATPTKTMRRSRPHHIADLLVVRDGSSAADPATDTSAYSSSHWAMVTRDPYAEKRAPAQVKGLARELGVDARVAWEALDAMYG